MKKRRTREAEVGEQELTELDIEILKEIAGAGSGGLLRASSSEEEVVEWLDCGWKRNPCEKRSCPLCGLIARDRARLAREGKDPDSIQSAFDSAGASVAEALVMIKAEADRMGIDVSNLNDIEEPPRPDAFPMAREAQNWYASLMRFAKEETNRGAPWLMTEAAADLLWYASIYSAKLYRQLCNRWHLEQADEYGEFDYRYTASVLSQVERILDRAFGALDDIAAGLRRHLKRYQRLKQAAHAELSSSL